MSDLSRLLDGLYSDDDETATTEPAADPVAEPAPGWASDEALDDVFSTWVPGPAEDAGSTERSLMASAVSDVAVAPAEPVTWDGPQIQTVEIDMGAAVDMGVEPTHDEPTHDEPFPAEVTHAEPIAVRTGAWSPTDDDILPGKRAKAAKGKSGRTAKAAKAEPKGKRGRKANAEPKVEPEPGVEAKAEPKAEPQRKFKLERKRTKTAA